MARETAAESFHDYGNNQILAKISKGEVVIHFIGTQIHIFCNVVKLGCRLLFKVIDITEVLSAYSLDASVLT